MSVCPSRFFGYALILFAAAAAAACVGAGTGWAAPKNTLPPGFNSSPLPQPDVGREDEEEDEQRQQQKDDIGRGLVLDPNNPEATEAGGGVGAALPLFDQSLLLPTTTGLFYGAAGLGEDIWLGTDEERLRELIAGWQVQPRTWPVAQLARKLLLTQASTPTGMDPFAFLLMRLEKLYILGDLTSVLRFFDLYPVLAARQEFNLLYQKVVFSFYGNSSRAVRDGCALWRAARSNKQDSESVALQIEALCLAVSGQSGLGLAKAERLSDSDQAPRAFFPLLASALDSRGGALDRSVQNPGEINNILWALYKANRKRPRSLSVKKVEPALLAVMARDSSLPHGWRLALTQRGILRGIIPPRKLQAFYERRSAPLQDDFTPPLKFNRTRQENKLQAQRISNILSTAPTRAAYMASLYAWGRDIANLPVAGTPGAGAGYRPLDGMAASLLFNQTQGLENWVATRGVASEPLALRAMRAIMADKARSSQRGVSRQVLARWRETMEQLIKIAAAEFFEQSDSGLPDGDETPQGDTIIEAGEDKKNTEVLLGVLSGLDNPVLARDPSFLRAVVKSLRAVGLEQEAWRIMIDSFLLESWGA